MSSPCSHVEQEGSKKPKSSLLKYGLKVLSILLIFTFLSTTIIFGVLWRKKISSSLLTKYAVDNGTIGFPPVLPNDGKYIQWTILQLNDVYEMLPLDQGQKGGLARVARVRQLLLRENSETFTILSGDFLSPSALSQSIVNGTKLNGRQMIASLNTLGLDFVTFGNHEFDLNESELISRMNESRFTWISSNVFPAGTNKSFSISIPYKILTIDQVRILFFGLTIDAPKTKSYVDIINEASLIPFVQRFLKSISDIKYDVLIALTHLDMATDIELTEKVPEINLILGGHEHEDYYYLRGSKYTPIYKADANAFTVYIHRCAFNLDTKRFRIYSTLTKITPELSDESKTSEVVNYWYNLGIKGFEEMGYEPNKTVSCLPSGVTLDGRSSSVRKLATLLSTYCCECMVASTNSSNTTVGLFNSGSIRIDDILRGTITQYDILRTLPYQDNLFALSVPGEILAKVLSDGAELEGNGMFISYSGVKTPDKGKTWIINGTDISKSGLRYNVATISFAKSAVLNDTSVSVLEEYNITQTKSLIDYLRNVYPPC